MIPSLAMRGKLVLASGTTFLLVGGLHASPPLVALGGVVLASLMTAYLWFFPTAILLRRKKIEMSWWVPPGDQPGGALSVERPFTVHVAFRNHGARGLRVLDTTVLTTGALEVATRLEAVVPPGKQTELMAQVRARAAGYHVLHGAVLQFGDVLGLFAVRAYFPNPVAVKVFPRQLVPRGAVIRPSGAAQHEQIGLHHVRRRGLAGELRELRDHTGGDPFKYIAWKATARRRKLTVRDLETEIVVTHQLLVDISGSMRGGAPGNSKLDWAIETVTALARAAIETGDRAGLVTYDSRVYAELRSGTGHHHYLKLVDRLIETRTVVDEDLTDLTSGELVATVARYLAHQEAIDVRLRQAPPLDDPQWQTLHAGPSGELYDLAAMTRIVTTLLESMNQAKAHRAMAPAWWWSRVHASPDADPQLVRLRLFCRLRGIELPYRRDHELGRRAQGLHAALERVASEGRADMIVIVSDLRGVIERPEITARALVQARRTSQQVVALVPFAPLFARTPTTAFGARVAEVLTREEHDVLGEARRLFASYGARVVPCGPGDDPSLIIRRLGRGRSRGGVRRVA